MNNKDFIELSEKEVEILNGSKHEESNEAWRGGYNYLAAQIKHSSENDSRADFEAKIEAISSDFEEFKFNVKPDFQRCGEGENICNCNSQKECGYLLSITLSH